MTELVYLSGPMSGRPDLNRPAFERAAASLRESGYYQVLTPFDCAPNPRSYQEAMRLDIAALVRCTHIAFLPGWEDSRGAKAEAVVAAVCGIRPIYLTPSEQRNEVLAKIDRAETAALAAMPALTAENFAEEARADAQREARPRRWWQLWGA